MTRRRRKPSAPRAVRKVVKVAKPDKSTERRLWAFLSPWVLMSLVLLVGALLHLRVSQAGGAMVAVAPLAFVAAGSGLGVLAYHYAHARRPLQRWHVAATVVAGGLGLALMSVTGLTGATRSSYIFAGALVALSWNLRRFEVVRGDGTDKHGDGSEGGWPEVLGLPGSRVKVTKVDGPRIEATVTTVNGQSAADVQRAAPNIAAAASVPANGVRVRVDPDHADRAQMVMVTEDVLRRPVHWPGPSAAGQTIAKPLIMGRFETAEEITVFLPGDKRAHRNASHWLVMGMTGAGKSEGWAWVEAAEILTRTDAVLWWVDYVKGAQTVWPIRSGLDWFASSKPEAKAMLSALRRVLVARTNYLGQRRYSQWQEGCGIPLLVVHVEEASDLLGDSESFVRLTEQCRSAGIILIVSLQRAVADNLPTSARANLGASACMGVRDSTDATFALPEDAIEAGARPELWGNERPGYVYVAGPGVRRELWSTPGRTYIADGEAIRQAVVAHAGTRAKLDEVSATAAGDAYARREVAGATAATAVAMPAATDEEELTTVPIPDDPDEEYTVPPQPEPELAELDDPRAELAHDEAAEAVDLREPEPADPMTREQRVAAFAALVDDLTRDGRVEVQASALVDAYRTRAPGRSRPWVHEQIRALVDAGRAERLGGGRYALYPRALASAHRE